MSGDVTYQALDRLSYLPNREANKNGFAIAGQYYYNVYFTGGTIGNVTLSNVSFSGSINLVSNTTVAGQLTWTSISTPAYAAGKLYYDSDNDCMSFMNSDPNVILQIGQEEWIRVVNNSGSSIPNGSAVYLSGTSGGLPTIALAQANSATTTIGAGLTTETIANGAIGFVTSAGAIRGLNTLAFTAGQTVYISSTVAGGLTATAPLAPNYRYRLGIVGVVSATVGTIHVTPSTASLGNGTANQVFGMNAAGTLQEVKSLNGTTNRVTATNAANSITFDISSSYVGQNTITTLGTITTGAWTATVVNSTYGGTGVNNGGRTITYAGNITHAGAFTQTFTATANTAVTLPTTGTLSTLAGAEALTNKSVNGVTLTAAGSVTNFLNATGTYTPAGVIVDRAYSEYLTNADLSVVIPYDDTIPQNTEGTQILSVSITPKTITNRLRIRFYGYGSVAVSTDVIIAAIFQNAGANAIASSASCGAVGGTAPVATYAEYEFVPASTSAQTFTVRVGGTAGTIRMNGTTSARRFGGTSRSIVIVEEIVS